MNMQTVTKLLAMLALASNGASFQRHPHTFRNPRMLLPRSAKQENSASESEPIPTPEAELVLEDDNGDDDDFLFDFFDNFVDKARMLLPMSAKQKNSASELIPTPEVEIVLEDGKGKGGLLFGFEKQLGALFNLEAGLEAEIEKLKQEQFEFAIEQINEEIEHGKENQFKMYEGRNARQIKWLLEQFRDGWTPWMDNPSSTEEEFFNEEVRRELEARLEMDVSIIK